MDLANSTKMKDLDREEFQYIATDSGTVEDAAQRTKILSNCMAPQSVCLKIGAQVMLIKNIDGTLVNGSIGKVIASMDHLLPSVIA